MKIMCVDDETVVLNHTLHLCEALGQKPQVFAYSKALAALEGAEQQDFDIALLDIDMPDMNGLTLAARIKEISPDTSIIFLTGYSQYAADAFKLHASGYLLKPIDRKELEEEINYAMSQKPQQVSSAHIVARTFGEFDLFVDGEAVVFPRLKAKEILAFLIDNQGSNVTTKMIFAALFEDEIYDRSKQKYLSILINSMLDTLEKYGVSDIVERRRGLYRIVPEKIDCDMFRFFEGDAQAINSYRGQYMNSYPWAAFSEAKLTNNI
jgi:two-component SAPR family response regulator